MYKCGSAKFPQFVLWTRLTLTKCISEERILCFTDHCSSDQVDTKRCSWASIEVAHWEKHHRSSISHLSSLLCAHLLTSFVKSNSAFLPHCLHCRLPRWDLWCRHSSYLLGWIVTGSEGIESSIGQVVECSFLSRRSQKLVKYWNLSCTNLKSVDSDMNSPLLDWSYFA